MKKARVENKNNFLKKEIFCPFQNLYNRGTFICGSCARHDVVEDTGRGQQSVKQVFQLFSKDGCEMTSEKS